jgi:MoaA/NifB/PqqE/SkfB family radical SAM enzyme
MYNLSDITSIHLEVTSKCQARCPMCPRRPGGGPINPYITLEEITLEQFKEWFNEDFIKQLTHLFMCGNLGDPIIAKDTLEIFKYIRSHNSTITLHMHTNGSARSAQWWKELARLNVAVIFGIDGLADTHSLYRISTDWQTIIDNAKTFIEAGGDARWDMLIFHHNMHQVEECRLLSEQLGFKDFKAKNTSRFRGEYMPVIDDEGRTTHVLYPTEKSEAMLPKINKTKQEVLPTITCKAKQNNQIYVSATGNLTPCCWLDNEWDEPLNLTRIDYKDKIRVYPNLKKNTLEEIFESGYFNKIASCWDTTGLRECGKQCGSFDKLNEQYK